MRGKDLGPDPDDWGRQRTGLVWIGWWKGILPSLHSQYPDERIQAAAEAAIELTGHRYWCAVINNALSHHQRRPFDSYSTDERDIFRAQLACYITSMMEATTDVASLEREIRRFIFTNVVNSEAVHPLSGADPNPK